LFKAVEFRVEFEFFSRLGKAAAPSDCRLLAEPALLL